MAIEVIVGIDIGGSHTGIGYFEFTSHQNLLIIEEPLNNSEESSIIINSIIQRINSDLLNNKWKVRSIGIGCPGYCKNGVLIVASNLPTFSKVPIAKLFQDTFQVPSILLNDADAAISSEVFGNLQQYRDLNNIAMITIGTGLGLGLILNKRLYQGSHGLIEGGHMIISSSLNSNRTCGCGQLGCIEVIASAHNTAKRYLTMDNCSIKDNQKINFGTKELFQLAFEQNDFSALKVIEESVESLAIMCINICRIVDPDAIILGGGMAKAGYQLLRLIENKMHELTWKVLPTDVKLYLSSSDGSAGIIGAALAGKNSLLSSIK